MAIDAELRSGTIDGNEARRRRRQLSRESQFYGAMDGAMKFVNKDFRSCALGFLGLSAQIAAPSAPGANGALLEVEPFLVMGRPA
jgi:hypothetical protein